MADMLVQLDEDGDDAAASSIPVNEGRVSNADLLMGLSLGAAPVDDTLSEETDGAQGSEIDQDEQQLHLNFTKPIGPKWTKVNEVMPEQYDLNLRLKVVNCDVNVELKQMDGNVLRVSEALVGDNTGMIYMTAINVLEQVDIVSPGTSIILKKVPRDEGGEIIVAEEPHPFDVEDYNVSLIEYELVNG